jgi:RNA polymerase sigma factor (sigma-70 family)
MSEEELQLVRSALAGDRECVRRLIKRLRPVVHAEVAHVLLRGSSSRRPRQELEDLVQEVFVRLWAHDGRLLRQWQPERGRSLESWVRLVGRSRVLDLLRSRRQTPAATERAEDDVLDGAGGVAEAPADTILARDTLARLQSRLRERLSERDWQLFIALIAEGCPVAQVSEETGMTPAAVYQWKSRFVRNLLPELAADLAGGLG